MLARRGVFPVGWTAAVNRTPPGDRNEILVVVGIGVAAVADEDTFVENREREGLVLGTFQKSVRHVQLGQYMIWHVARALFRERLARRGAQKHPCGPNRYRGGYPTSGMADFTVTIAGHELSAEWTDDNPTTRTAVADALPLSGDATRWGDELYFRTDIDVPLENGQEEVPVGAIAYWPQGEALCLFWGPTPASRGEEPRAASPVNIVGQLTETTPLASLEGGAPVTIERT